MLYLLYVAIAVAALALLVEKTGVKLPQITMSRLSPLRSSRSLRTPRVGRTQRTAVNGGKRRDFFGDRVAADVRPAPHPQPAARQPSRPAVAAQTSGI